VRARPSPSFPGLRASFVAGVTALSLIAPPAAADPPLAPLALPAPRPVPSPPRDDNRALRFTGGIALAGVGLVFVVLGSVLGARAIVDKNAIGSHCDAAARCDLAGYSLGSEAQDFAALATVGFGFGLPALVGGVVLAVTGAPKKSAGMAWLTAGGVRW
jgi:hypothetical protein